MALDSQRVQELLAAACEMSSDVQVAAHLERECADDTALRREVESLLHSIRNAGGFLADPAVTLEQPLEQLLAGENLAIGNYRLLSLIGEGGFGSVFLAEQQRPVRRKVALKVVKLGMDTRQVVARFEREQQAMARMEHPHIVKVFDAGVAANGRPYFVMEWVPGPSITRYCDEHCLAVRGRLELFEQVCRAVQHAHEKGVIHRDIKPSNVLVAVTDQKPTPRVIDFGIAKAVTANPEGQADVTQTRQILGTLHYISPEQALMMGGEVDVRTDIYSLGVLLYELLTGTVPYDPNDLGKAAAPDIQRIICDVTPPPPSLRVQTGEDATARAARRRTDPRHLRKVIEGELDWLVMKCLEKLPARRYESAHALAEDVRRFLDGQPVAARPVSFLRRVAIRLRRHRLAGSIAAIACAALGVGIFAGVLVRHDPAQARRPSAEPDASVPTPPLAKVVTVDLFPLIDVAQGRLAGRWEKSGTTLVAQGGETPVRLSIPYQPVGDYEFEIEFTVEKGDGPVIQICPTSGGNLLWQVAWDGYGFEGAVGLPGGKRPLLHKSVLYRGTVKVRQSTISGNLDGVQVAAFERQSQGFGLANSVWNTPDEKLLGLGVWNSRVEFSKIVVHKFER